jgi:hypothetical protein
MQHRDDCVAFRINNENHAIHAFAISRWNAVRQSSQLSATDHERSTPPADKWTAVGIAVNCLQNSHRNAPCLCTLASVIGQNQRRYGWLIYLHDPISPVAARNAASITGTEGMGIFLHGRRLFLAPANEVGIP